MNIAASFPRISGRARQVLRPLTVVLITAAVVYTAVRFVVGPGGVVYHIDFDVYRSGGHAVLDSVPLYQGSFRVGGITLPFTYPPLSAVTFVPLALMPLWLGEVVFTVVSVVALLLTAVITLRSLSRESGDILPRHRLWTTAAVVTAAGVFAWPVVSTLEYGQINIVLMLLVAADLLLPRTPWPRGMLVGLAAALKLTPAVFGLFYLLRRQWKDAATSVISGLAFTALAWVILPADSLRYWTETVSDPTRIGGLMYSANQSWRGAVARFTDDPLQTRIWVTLAVVTVVAVTVVMYRQLSVGATTAAVCTNALLGLLASPVSWAHHWVWVVPMAVVAVASACRAGTGQVRRAAVFLAVVVTVVPVLLVVHTWFPSTHDVERTWSVAMKILGSELVLTGVCWLVIGGLLPRATRPAPRADARTEPGAAPVPST